ncbi:hypothetical protein Brms1b_013165 [Colletotrichum noveboracense]|nr:hypothetical protein Brms1b_013165 [Colletotrichum noveboracense]
MARDSLRLHVDPLRGRAHNQLCVIQEVIVNNVRIGNGNGGKHHSRIVDGQQDLNGGYEHINNQCDINLNAG